MQTRACWRCRGYCPAFKDIGLAYGPFDAAAIPIGAYSPGWFLEHQHVNPEQAVQVLRLMTYLVFMRNYEMCRNTVKHGCVVVLVHAIRLYADHRLGNQGCGLSPSQPASVHCMQLLEQRSPSENPVNITAQYQCFSQAGLKAKLDEWQSSGLLINLLFFHS